MNFPNLVFLHLTNLSLAFDPYDTAPNLLYYLAKPKYDPGNFDYDAYYESLQKRIPFDQLGQSGYGNIRYAPQDRGVLMSRSNILANDNRAYSIAIKNYPTAQELEEFADKKPGWALPFAVKDYLMHHLDVAPDYFGFCPMGGPVVTFLQNLDNPPSINFSNLSYKDHVMIREITNSLAHQYNLSPIMINNLMYIEGKKIRETPDSGDDA